MSKNITDIAIPSFLSAEKLDAADVQHIGFAIDGGVGMPDLAKVEVDGEPAWKFPDAPNPKWRYATLTKVNGKNDMLLVSRDARTWSLAIAVVVKGELCFKEDLDANEVAR